MANRTGETITIAEEEVAISLEEADTSVVVIPITTTKIETVAGEIEEVKEEEATVVVEIKVAGVTEEMTIEIETMMTTVDMVEVAGETEIEEAVDMEGDTKDKTPILTTVDQISDRELKDHQEVKHQALVPLNRKESLPDQDVLFTLAIYSSKSTSKSSWNYSKRKNSIQSEPDSSMTMKEILKELDLSR